MILIEEKSYIFKTAKLHFGYVWPDMLGGVFDLENKASREKYLYENNCPINGNNTGTFIVYIKKKISTKRVASENISTQNINQQCFRRK
jgi:hypothetical protein